jgi:antibiotic biosynthesis monooxygenase (ABM) superfamily enzyme
MPLMEVPIMIVLLVEHFFTPEGRERFPSWIREIGRVASRFPGFVDIRQMTRIDEPERCFFELSFEGLDNAKAWIDCPERQDLLALMDPYRLKPQEGTRWLAGDSWSASDEAT